MRKLSLFIATSLDGYIASPNENLDFLKLVEKEGEDYGYAEFTSEVDTIIIGRKTYDWVVRQIGPAHYDNGQKDVYVITSSPLPSSGKTRFYHGNPCDLVRRLKNEKGKTIYCDGGAELINALLKDDLIDEMTMSVVPVLLGDGTRLFKDGRPEQVLELQRSGSFATGLVQLQFRRKRSS